MWCGEWRAEAPGEWRAEAPGVWRVVGGPWDGFLVVVGAVATWRWVAVADLVV
ncbi:MULTISPECIES: hypothetical protein [unclassified Saccharothrix]|uniref:hypothetical protein n=1 Tax=unclassified Saccharothrix TaxID=2593673 RepID=UPI00307FB573